jgi:hypothetical protein
MKELPSDGGKTFLKNVWTFVPDNIVSGQKATNFHTNRYDNFRFSNIRVT